MVLAFPTVVSFIAAVSSFLCSVPWLCNFQLSEISPKLRVGLSREERQKKITVGRRTVYVMSAFMLASRFVFAWMANSK